MEKTRTEQTLGENQQEKYEPPRVLSISKEKLMAELGPARACTSWFGGVAGFCDPSYPPNTPTPTGP
jgi:hypothetical protein